MALLKTWKEYSVADSLLLPNAVEKGLHKLGYTNIKQEQLIAIESMLKREDLFMSVPTGFGKSLVYD